MCISSRIHEMVIYNREDPGDSYPDATMAWQKVKQTRSTRSPENGMVENSKKAPTISTHFRSSVRRTGNAIVISLRGADLQWLLSEIQGCRGSDPTVQIIFNEDTSPPQPSNIPHASEESSLTPNILDTLRVTPCEKNYLERVSGGDGSTKTDLPDIEEDCALDPRAIEAYMISTGLSDTEPEWNEFTTF